MSRSTGPFEGRNEALRLLLKAAFVLVVLGAITGCGGSSDGDPSSGEGATATDEDEAAESAASNETSGDPDPSGNYARVTIGSETFEIPPDGLNLCNSLGNQVFGSFAAGADGSATQAGGTDAATQVNFGVPVTNWEEEGLQAPIVNLDLLDEGIRWFASVDRGLGSVDSWELADGKATGEATFEAEQVGSGTAIGSETGSFEIVCR